MGKKKYPLELILRAHGPAELVDADEVQIWASDADEDFRDEFPDEFLSEDDAPDILDYLKDANILNAEEYGKLCSDSWDVTIETLQNAAEGPDDDGDDGEEYDED
jgi:hypothetical protein